MQLTDILIHLDKNITATEKEKLVEQLRGKEGVIAPRFNSEKEHLLLVAYNSEATNASNLLSEIKNKGYQAQLVGM